jgi:hypothetical protein
MGRNEALQAFGNVRQDIHTFGFDSICWFGLEWEESERALLQEARYHHPPRSWSWRGNRLKENYCILYENKKTYPYINT